MIRTFAPGVWTIARSWSAGARSALLIGAWLLLTFLFVFVGVVLIGTIVTALDQSNGPVSILVVVGVLGTSGVSPTLAKAVIVRAVERFEAVFDRSDDAEPDGRLLSLYDLKGRVYCRVSGECCC